MRLRPLDEMGKGLLVGTISGLFGGTARLLVAALAVLLLASVVTCVPGRSNEESDILYSGLTEMGID